MTWVGPNGRIYATKRWAIVAALGAAAATLLAWFKVRKRDGKG